jgi:hypothetical protein
MAIIECHDIILRSIQSILKMKGYQVKNSGLVIEFWKYAGQNQSVLYRTNLYVIKKVEWFNIYPLH